MKEILLLLAAGLLGWLFARRQKTTEPPVTPPKTNPQRETYVDRIDEITRSADSPTPSPDTDSDLADWINRNVGGGK